MRIFFIILSVFIGLSCSNEKQNSNTTTSSNPNIEDLIQQIKENPSNENKKLLADKYLELAQNNQNTSEFLEKAGNLYLETENIQEAVTALGQNLRLFPNNPNAVNIIQKLADIYEVKFNKPDLANVLYTSSLEKYKDFSGNKAYEAKLKDRNFDINKYLKSLIEKMANSDSRINNQVANDYLNASELMNLAGLKGDLSIATLHRAAEVARTIKNFPKAIYNYKWIMDLAPNSKYARQSLFMMGFTYDNDLNNKDLAKKYYTEFLNKYPDSDFADDATFLLGNLDKSNEEIIKQFSKK